MHHLVRCYQKFLFGFENCSYFILMNTRNYKIGLKKLCVKDMRDGR